MNEPIQPERYKQYWATVHYHSTDDLRPPFDEQGVRRIPEEGARILVQASWMMDEDEAFPGEFTFTVKSPDQYCYWLPQRDLTDFEEVEYPPVTA